MCMNCGCGEVDARHDNEANIVAEDVRRAASTNGLDVNTTVRNLQDALSRLGGGQLAGSGAGSRSGMGDGTSGDQGTPRR